MRSFRRRGVHGVYRMPMRVSNVHQFCASFCFGLSGPGVTRVQGNAVIAEDEGRAGGNDCCCFWRFCASPYVYVEPVPLNVPTIFVESSYFVLAFLSRRVCNPPCERLRANARYTILLKLWLELHRGNYTFCRDIKNLSRVCAI